MMCDKKAPLVQHQQSMLYGSHKMSNVWSRMELWWRRSLQVTLVFTFIGFLIILHLDPVSLVSQKSLTDKVLEIVPLTDGHKDFPIWLRVFYHNQIYDFNSSSLIDGQVDFPRLREGRLGAQFWSVYVPYPEVDNNFSSSVYHGNCS